MFTETSSGSCWRKASGFGETFAAGCFFFEIAAMPFAGLRSGDVLVKLFVFGGLFFQSHESTAEDERFVHPPGDPEWIAIHYCFVRFGSDILGSHHSRFLKSACVHHVSLGEEIRVGCTGT